MKIKDHIGEATSYDKKLILERKNPTSWLKSVSAFVNMQGGKLLFGVANVDWGEDRNVVRILDVVRDNPHITQHEIATSLNPSLRGVEDMMRTREKGLIRRIGGKHFGHWEVVKLSGNGGARRVGRALRASRKGKKQSEKEQAK